MFIVYANRLVKGWNIPFQNISKRFQNFVNVILLVVDMSLFQRTWPFIWTNLNLNPSRMLCAKLRWFCPVFSSRRFLISSICFAILCLSTLGKSEIGILFIPSCLVEISPLVLEKNILKNRQCIFTILVRTEIWRKTGV